MGNKLSCSCAPLIRSKTYRYEDSPWQAGARGGMGGGGGRRGDTGHLLRCGSLRERKRCAYHTIQPFNHSPFDHVTTLSLQWLPYTPLTVCIILTLSFSLYLLFLFFFLLFLFFSPSIFFASLLIFLNSMRIKHVGDENKIFFCIDNNLWNV